MMRIPACSVKAKPKPCRPVAITAIKGGKLTSRLVSSRGPLRAGR